MNTLPDNAVPETGALNVIMHIPNCELASKPCPGTDDVANRPTSPPLRLSAKPRPVYTRRCDLSIPQNRLDRVRRATSD